MPEFGIKAKKRNRPEKGILFGAPKFSQLKSNYWIFFYKMFILQNIYSLKKLAFSLHYKLR